MKVLVADDHWVVRAGLSYLLRQLDDSVSIVEADGYEEAAAVADAGGLDLAIIDLVMPGMEAFTGLMLVLEKLEGVPTVVVSAVGRRQEMLRAIELGVVGYIPKSFGEQDFLKALRQVLAGEIYVPKVALDGGPGSDEEAARAAQPMPPAEVVGALTKRQRDVFGLLAQGHSNKEIARQLGVSEHTVRIHISAILKALKVANRTQAALLSVPRPIRQ